MAMVLCAGLLFTLDMFLRFHIAVPIKTDTRVMIVPDGKVVAKNYALKGSFAIDFLATLPSWLEVSRSLPEVDTQVHLFRGVKDSVLCGLAKANSRSPCLCSYCAHCSPDQALLFLFLQSLR